MTDSATAYFSPKASNHERLHAQWGNNNKKQHNALVVQYYMVPQSHVHVHVHVHAHARRAWKLQPGSYNEDREKQNEENDHFPVDVVEE